ncbi:ABC transporter membrane-spanning permease - glutamine transport [Streptococcus oralis]|nr:ABC transporter membrane-spanning permease - glutamine transport [Streptococcus oralis]
MNSGAYVSETVRAGINAVPKGQLEAAYSLGIRTQKCHALCYFATSYQEYSSSAGK